MAGEAENLLDDQSPLPTAMPQQFPYPRQSALSSIKSLQDAYTQSMQPYFGKPSALDYIRDSALFAPKMALDTAMIGPRLFSDVAEGRLDPNSPEGIRRAVDFALTTIGFGSLGAERGAIGALGGYGAAKHEALVAKIAAGKPTITLPKGPGEFSKLTPMASEPATQVVPEYNEYINSFITPEGQQKALQLLKTDPDKFHSAYDIWAADNALPPSHVIDTALQSMPTPLWKLPSIMREELPPVRDLPPEDVRQANRIAGGYTTPVFHGASNPLSSSNLAASSYGFYATSEPKLADLYSKIPVDIAARKREPVAEDIENLPFRSNVTPMYLNTSNFHEVDAGGSVWSGLGGQIMRDAVDHARKTGQDGVIVRNIFDEPSGESKHLGAPKDVYILLKGHEHVARSPFAAFDPSKRNMSDLLASVGGISLAAGTLPRLVQGRNGDLHHLEPIDHDPFGETKQ